MSDLYARLGAPALGWVSSSEPSYTAGIYAPASLTTTGRLRVDSSGSSISGNVTVTNFPATQTVTQGTNPWVVSGSTSINNFPATQPVSGTVAVSNFPATQPVSGTVAVSNFPAVQTVTSTKRNTYSATILNSTIANPVFVSNFFAVSGSATKLVKITKLQFDCTETTTGQKTFAAYFITGLTGGTPTTVTPVSYDSTNPTATATATQYAIGTTPAGSAQVLLRGWSLCVPAPGGAVDPTVITEIFDVNNCQPITLRGTNQSFCLALIGGTIVGGAVTAYIEWTEE